MTNATINARMEKKQGENNMEDFISARSIIRKEIDVLTQHRDQAEEGAKRTIGFIKKAKELPHTDIDIVNNWWENYQYYKGKAQGLDIAIADLETIIVNISQMQDLEIQKNVGRGVGRGKK